MLKISLDLDGTVFNWEEHYINNFGVPKTDKEITKHITDDLKSNMNFWLSQPILNYPDFTPSSYCTARIINKTWIKKQIKVKNLPKAPIYQVLGFNLSKVPQLKRSACDVHIDDSLKVFIDANLHGIPCLLIDTPYNQDWGPIGRIYSLKESEIIECYNLFMNTVFHNFKGLLNGY